MVRDVLQAALGRFHHPREWRRELRLLLGQSPALFYPVESFLRPQHRPILVGRGTDLVVEGYPRSSNSFTVAAFRYAQKRPVRIAHHVHVPAQVVRAAALSIPCLVLLRDPVQAILSHGAFTPDVSLAQIVRGYELFYARILPLRDRYVLASFEETTADLGAVIDAVNRRFGTNFQRFEHTQENVDAVLKGMQERAQRREGERWTLRSSVPTDVRNSRKEALEAELFSPALATPLKRAQAVYERMMATGTLC